MGQPLVFRDVSLSNTCIHTYLVQYWHPPLAWQVVYRMPDSVSKPPPSAKQDGDRISKQFLCGMWKKRNERPNVGGVSIRSRNGAQSRKGCVLNGQMTKTSNK